MILASFFLSTNDPSPSIYALKAFSALQVQHWIHHIQSHSKKSSIDRSRSPVPQRVVRSPAPISPSVSKNSDPNAMQPSNDPASIQRIEASRKVMAEIIVKKTTVRPGAPPRSPQNFPNNDYTAPPPKPAHYSSAISGTTQPDIKPPLPKRDGSSSPLLPPREPFPSTSTSTSTPTSEILGIRNSIRQLETKLEEIAEQKKQAIAHEDYDLAKVCKKNEDDVSKEISNFNLKLDEVEMSRGLDYLKSEIFKLNNLKEAAADSDDFATASKYKKDLLRLQELSRKFQEQNPS
eukprot:TRINITY_DN2352_c0_g1_i2.p1 TRINITY_DN2352_c0_g1~~TRINITY_DN2352_c0_g1_i2.p1  ORF type:complete len:291 (+),score=114.01 TRINITY_DN2352_c0_g1_i2:552-1424(+)